MYSKISLTRKITKYFQQPEQIVWSRAPTNLIQITESTKYIRLLSNVLKVPRGRSSLEQSNHIECRHLSRVHVHRNKNVLGDLPGPVNIQTSIKKQSACHCLEQNARWLSQG